MNITQNVGTLFETLLWLKERFREKNEDGDYKWDVSDLNIYFPQVLYGNVVDIRLVEAEKMRPSSGSVVVKEKIPTQTDIITQELIESLPEEVVSVSVEPPVAPAPRRGGRPRK